MIETIFFIENRNSKTQKNNNMSSERTEKNVTKTLYYRKFYLFNQKIAKKNPNSSNQVNKIRIQSPALWTTRNFVCFVNIYFIFYSLFESTETQTQFRQRVHSNFFDFQWDFRLTTFLLFTCEHMRNLWITNIISRVSRLPEGKMKLKLPADIAISLPTSSSFIISTARTNFICSFNPRNDIRKLSICKSSKSFSINKTEM